MARKRMIDPNIWQSEDFSRLSSVAKLFFIGMFSNADDEGRGRAKAAYLKSVIFPYDDGMRLIDVEKALSEIGSNMSVTFYAHDGNQYYQLNNWTKWQSINRPLPSSIPSPADTSQILTEDSRSVHGALTEDSRVIEENRREVEKNRKEEKEGARGEKAAPKVKYADFVSMTNDEHSSLVAKLGEQGAARCVEILDNYKGSNNKTYASDYRAILNWVVGRYEEEQQRGPPGRTKPDHLPEDYETDLDFFSNRKAPDERRESG